MTAGRADLEAEGTRLDVEFADGRLADIGLLERATGELHGRFERNFVLAKKHTLPPTYGKAPETMSARYAFAIIE